MTSCRNRSRSPSSPSTRPAIPSASTPNSSTTGRSIVTDRSVTVKAGPQVEANRSACSVSSDRKLSRRRIVSRSVGGSAGCATSARPPAVSIMPSSASAASISVTNSGLPAAPRQPGHQPLARRRAHRVGGQVGHRLRAETAQAQVPARCPLQRGGEPVQLGGAGQRPETRDEGPPEGIRPGVPARPASAGSTRRPTAGRPRRSPAARPARAPPPGRRARRRPGTAVPDRSSR